MVTKTVVKQKTKTQTAVDSTETLEIDTYAALFEKVEAAKKKLKPYTKELEGLESGILEKAADNDPAEEVMLHGEEYTVELGAMGLSSEITDLKEVVRQLRAIDTDLPWKLMKFNVGDLEKYLTPETLEKVVKKDRTRKRRVKVEKRVKIVD